MNSERCYVYFGTNGGTWVCRFSWSTGLYFRDLPFVFVMFNKTANRSVCGADIEASRDVCFLNDTPFLSTWLNVASLTNITVRPSPNPLSRSWRLRIINTELRPRRAIKVGLFCVLEQSGTVTEPILHEPQTAWQICVRNSKSEFH